MFLQAVFGTEQLSCSCSMVFGMFLACLFLTQTEHFAMPIAFAWVVAFGRWPIFKIVLFLEYLFFFFKRFSAQNNSNVLVEWFLACLIFDQN